MKPHITTKHVGCDEWVILIDGAQIQGTFSTNEVDREVERLESLTVQNAAHYTHLCWPMSACN